MDMRAVIQRNAWLTTTVALAFMRAACIKRTTCKACEEYREDPELKWCRTQRYSALERRY